MDFDGMIQIINDLLVKEDPDTFSGSWILKQFPHCYRFIWKNVRADYGTVDWDRVTRALECKFQRRWTPMRRVRSYVPYKNDGVDRSSVPSTTMRLRISCGMLSMVAAHSVISKIRCTGLEYSNYGTTISKKPGGRL